MYRLGKRTAQPNGIKLKFGRYFAAADLPAVPAVFGYGCISPQNPHPVIVQDFGMLANDVVGDCVCAGAMHEHQYMAAAAGRSMPLFNSRLAIQMYSDVAGYNGTPESDQGTDVLGAAKYRQTKGVLDRSGMRHTIDIYAALRVGDLDQLNLACFLTGAVGLGVQFPTSAMDQFHAAQPFDTVNGSATEGGHYMAIVGRNSHGNILAVTWGRLVALTPRWVTKYMDEGVVYLSRDRLSAKGLSPQGYDAAALTRDFEQVTA